MYIKKFTDGINMSDKWLDSNERILLENKAWIWVKDPYSYLAKPNHYKLIRSKIFLTNKRLHFKGVLFKTNLFDVPISTIKYIEASKTHLRMDAIINKEPYTFWIRLKDIDDGWEFLIKDRLKAIEHGSNKEQEM
jgi:hypothetical protein